MAICQSCGSNVTGKKFCPDCGTPVKVVSAQSTITCPSCGGEIKAGTMFCMHCGSSLSSSVQSTPVPPPPVAHSCPSCHAQVPMQTVFCTQCGHDMRVAVTAQTNVPILCSSCGRQNASGMRFCGGCGSSLAIGMPSQASGQYQQSGQYPPQGQYQQSGQYPPQTQYPQYPQPQYSQGNYVAQPMLGQAQMALRCPVCMAMAQVGTPNCMSCRTSLAGVVPTPVPMQGQQSQQGGLGGLMQGNNGKVAMGVLGGAAAVIGGEMLLHGLENNIENRVEGDMGYGSSNRGHHNRRDGGLLGGLGELADDIGLI